MVHVLRGCSVVGTDLRRTKIIPKYVPYPTILPSKTLTQKSNHHILQVSLKVTGVLISGNSFLFFDGAEEGVYFKPDSVETLSLSFRTINLHALNLQTVLTSVHIDCW